MNMPKLDQIRVEELREMILENATMIQYVNDYAALGLKCLRSSMGPEELPIPKAVEDELICQYQTQAWNKVFTAISQF